MRSCEWHEAGVALGRARRKFSFGARGGRNREIEARDPGTCTLSAEPALIQPDVYGSSSFKEMSAFHLLGILEY